MSLTPVIEGQPEIADRTSTRNPLPDGPLVARPGKRESCDSSPRNFPPRCAVSGSDGDGFGDIASLEDADEDV